MLVLDRACQPPAGALRTAPLHTCCFAFFPQVTERLYRDMLCTEAAARAAADTANERAAAAESALAAAGLPLPAGASPAAAGAGSGTALPLGAPPPIAAATFAEQQRAAAAAAGPLPAAARAAVAEAEEKARAAEVARLEMLALLADARRREEATADALRHAEGDVELLRNALQEVGGRRGCRRGARLSFTTIVFLFACTEAGCVLRSVMDPLASFFSISAGLPGCGPGAGARRGGHVPGAGRPPGGGPQGAGARARAQRAGGRPAGSGGPHRGAPCTTGPWVGNIGSSSGGGGKAHSRGRGSSCWRPGGWCCGGQRGAASSAP